MNPKYWLVLGAVAVCAAQGVACSSNFTSCEASRSCPPGTGGGKGDAGDAAEAGESSSVAGKGGSGGSAGEAAVLDEAGAGGEVGVAGDSSAEAGMGGEPAGGAPNAGPTLFGACSVLGKVVCDGHASAQRLACDGTKWQAGTTCGAGQLCDSTTGECATQVVECVSAAPGQVVCRKDTPLTCGADLVTAEAGAECAGLCKDGACQAPVCGDKKVQTGEDCDDGNATSSGACVACKTAKCGDGALYAGHEQCDDKNNASGDGCSATCTAEPVAIAAGSDLTCALSSTGVVKCWGDNAHGGLGIGTTDARSDAPSKLPAVALGANRTAIAISVGNGAACALLDNGDVKCWGANASGQLGTGDTSDRGDTARELSAVALGGPATAVSTGGDHTCAVLKTGDLKCWGAGKLGQLGLDSTANHSLADQVAVALGAGRKATRVSAGSNYTTCALLEDATAKCWGYKYFGSLAVDPAIDLGGGSGYDGAIGDFSGEMAILPALTVGTGRTVKAIAAGEFSSCALLDDGTVKCWGSNYDGQLGQSSLNSGLGQDPASLTALPVIDLGTGRKAASISLAYAHVCAVLDDGFVKCWGKNLNGQLGIGSTDDKGDGASEMGNSLAAVPLGAGRSAKQVSAGRNHSCALLDNGTIKCWGLNDKAQLGKGDKLNQGDTGGPTGVSLTPVNLSF